MTDFLDDLTDFGVVDGTIREANDPEKNLYSNRINWIQKEIRLAEPKPDTRSRYRLLPYPKQFKIFERQVKIHYKVGTSKGAIACNTMRGMECPLCDRTSELYAAQANKAASEISGKKYHLFWVIDRDAEELGPQLWKIPPTTLQSIWNMIQHPTNSTYLPINSPFIGHDLFFVKRFEAPGKPFRTICDIKLDPESSPLSFARNVEEYYDASTKTFKDEKMQKWIAHVAKYTPIDPFMTFMTPKEMRAAMDAADGTNSDSAQDDFPPEESNKSADPWDAHQPEQAASNHPKSEPVAQVKEEVRQEAPVEKNEPVAEPLKKEEPKPVAASAGSPKVDMNSLKDMLANRAKK